MEWNGTSKGKEMMMMMMKTVLILKVSNLRIAVR